MGMNAVIINLRLNLFYFCINFYLHYDYFDCKSWLYKVENENQANLNRFIKTFDCKYIKNNQFKFTRDYRNFR